MDKEYIYVYQTICEANGKSYIGVHRTKDINDGYIGCGIFAQRDARLPMFFHRAVRKYGYASFKRHILSFYDTYQEALAEERYIVGIDWVKSTTNYNVALGGRGNTTTWMDGDAKAKWQSNISDGVKSWFSNGGLEKLREISKTAKRSRKFGDKNPMYGKPSPMQRSVLQYDINGNYIQKFTSISAAASFFNILPPNIVACCQGRYLTVGGVIFKYEKYSEEEQIKYDKSIIRPPKKVKQIKFVDDKYRMIIVDGAKTHSEETRLRLSRINTGRTHTVSDEARLKISNARKGVKLSKSHRESLSKNNARYWLGKKRSEATSLKLSIAHKGKTLTIEHRKKLSESHKGQISAQRKKIHQYSRDGSFLNEYHSIAEASKVLGCLNTSIQNNLAGRTSHCNNFIFKYTGG